MWGREILHLELSTVVPGAPSWKPLPVLATTPLALAGDAAPAVWLLLARAGALAGLVVAYRLAARLAGRWAGALAVLGLLLSTHWVREFAHGYTEPLAIGLLAGAVDRHLSGRRESAFLLGSLVALSRPESWLLLVAYAAVLWRRRQVHPLLLAAVLAAVPALWVVPDWVGSGDPFHASAVSRLVVPTGAAATLTALGEAAVIAPVPLLLTAIAGTLLAGRRGERALPGIAGVVAAWTALLVGMMLAGYPASSRFLVVPAGLLCVVGAAGAVRVAATVRGRGPALAAASILGLATMPLVAVRGEAVGDEASASVSISRLEADLRLAVDRGRGALLRCGTPVIPNGLLFAKGVVAWELDVPLRRVRGIPTSAFGFNERLADPGDEPLPRMPAGRTVTVSPRIRPFVLLVPYGDARIRVAAQPRARLTTVAAAGRWRVATSARGDGCPRS